MKLRIVQKDLILILGIVVAMLVAISLWVARPTEKPGSQATLFPEINPSIAAKSVIHRMAEVFFNHYP